MISDSLGETAELVARAAISQFNSGQAEIRRVPYVDRKALDEVLEQARRRKSVIVFTLVLPELRQRMLEEARRHGILYVDIMGPVMDALARVMPKQPRLEPGLLHRLDDDYFRRVEAVEFAVKYDDGKDPRGLLRADIVLLGVSRSSKTPVSMYLAHRRYKVANVPLVPEIPLPEEIFQLPSGKVVGLTIKPQQLLGIRQERVKTIGLGGDARYASLERILEELEYADRTFRRLGCPVVDVTNKAVEETAHKVLEILGKEDGNGA